MDIVARQALGLRIKKTIPGSSTLVVDRIKTTKFKNLRYYIVIFAGNETKSFDMSVTNKNGQLSDSVFGRIGLAPAVKVNAVIDGSDTTLEMINDNIFDIKTELIRFNLGGF